MARASLKALVVATCAVAMRRPLWTLFFTLVLLFGQHAAVEHGYGHHAAEASSCEEVTADAVCPICLSCGHLTAALEPVAVSAGLLAGLTFERPGLASIADVGATDVSPRSRGPPPL